MGAQRISVSTHTPGSRPGAASRPGGRLPTTAGVGRSSLRDAFQAGRTAAREAVEALDGAHVDCTVVFSTSRYDPHELLRGVREAVGDARLAGCSGEGVICADESLECDFAVSVMAIHSETMSFEPILLRGYTQDPSRRGAELAHRVAGMARDDLVGLLLFPDGLRGNCTDFLRSVESNLPAPISVAGGTAADAMVFERTYQFADDVVASDSIGALLIRGQGHMEVAVSHGCSPIGRERVITRAESGWIHEIDGRPAWEVFREYLDGEPEDLNAEGIVHLCIGQPLDPDAAHEYSPYVIRTPLRLDKKTGALFFPGGGLHADQRIRLTRRDAQAVRESALACARRIVSRQPDRDPALVFQLDCAGRGRVLFGSCAAEEIVRPLQEALGEGTPWIGFHTYGEIAPIAGRLYYHNYTVVLCALYDGE